ncbi:hypothetical protein D3C76_753660 [compost metagenome]
MKSLYRFFIIVVTIFFISGCTGEKPLPNEALQEEPRDTAELQSTENPTGYSEVEIEKLLSENSITPLLYYSVGNPPEINVSESQIIWKQNDIVFAADLSKSEGEQVYESDTVISKMHIESNQGSYTISLDKKPLRINSLSLSSVNYLAIHVGDHEGSRLIIVDLTTGSQVNINELYEEGVEAVNAYNWSPDGKQLACAIGNLGSSFLALYDAEKKSLKIVSDEDYESIYAVAWHRDGFGLDFISQKGDSEEALLRYREDSIKEVMKLDRSNRQMILDTIPVTVK